MALKGRCTPWTGTINSSGYGVRPFRGRTVTASRAAYIEARGEIPPGLEVDHLCRNKLCVNPDHLEAVTRTENKRRSLAARGSYIMPSRANKKVLVTLLDEEYRALVQLSKHYGLTRPQVLRQLLRAEVSRERAGRRVRLPGIGDDDGRRLHEGGTGTDD